MVGTAGISRLRVGMLGLLALVLMSPATPVGAVNGYTYEPIFVALG